jgi:hypothetical protein
LASLYRKIEEKSPLSTASVDFDDCMSDDYNPSKIPTVQLSSQDLSSKTSNCCPNPARSLMFHHIASGKQLPVPCNKYSCPYCGKRKAKQLYAAIYDYFRQFEYIRMWTLTLSSKCDILPEKHYEILQECWRRFITEVRRSKVLSSKQRNLQYIRVSEMHKSGFIHFHVLVTEYVEFKFLQAIWNHIIQDFTGLSGKQGNINIKGIKAHKEAAHYVVKYVLKGSLTIDTRKKKWTKSGRCSIMTKHTSSGEWLIINLHFNLIDQICLPTEWIDYTCKNNGISSQHTIKAPPPNSLDFQFEIFKNDKSLKIVQQFSD